MSREFYPNAVKPRSEYQIPLVLFAVMVQLHEYDPSTMSLALKRLEDELRTDSLRCSRLRQGRRPKYQTSKATPELTPEPKTQ